MSMASSNTRSATVGQCPIGIAVSDSQQFPWVYVANQRDNTVSVLKFPTIVDTIQHESFNGMKDIAYNPSNESVYVANHGGNYISVIQGTNWITNVQVGNSPFAMAYDPGNQFMFVTNYYSNSVSVIDSSNTVVSTVQVRHKPTKIAYNPLDGYMYVFNFSSSSDDEFLVSVIKPSSLIRDIPVVRRYEAIAYNPKYKKMYLPFTKADGSGIDLIDADPSNTNTYQEVLDTVLLPGLRNPSSGGGNIVYNPQDTNMYMTFFATNNLAVIQDTRHVNTIRLPYRSSFSMAYYGEEKSMILGTYNTDAYSTDRDQVYIVP